MTTLGPITVRFCSTCGIFTSSTHQIVPLNIIPAIAKRDFSLPFPKAPVVLTTTVIEAVRAVAQRELLQGTATIYYNIKKRCIELTGEISSYPHLCNTYNPFKFFS